MTNHDADRLGDRQRLDQFLVAAGHFATRSRARDAIERGTVEVDGVPTAKSPPAEPVVKTPNVRC